MAIVYLSLRLFGCPVKQESFRIDTLSTVRRELVRWIVWKREFWGKKHWPHWAQILHQTSWTASVLAEIAPLSHQQRVFQREGIVLGRWLCTKDHQSWLRIGFREHSCSCPATSRAHKGTEVGGCCGQSCRVNTSHSSSFEPTLFKQKSATSENHIPSPIRVPN